MGSGLMLTVDRFVSFWQFHFQGSTPNKSIRVYLLWVDIMERPMMVASLFAGIEVAKY